MRSLAIAVSFLLFVSACNNQSGEQEEKSFADSLFDNVIAGHDVAMPKMMKLERLQRQAKEAIDSIEQLPSAKRRMLADYKAQLDSALKALDYADFAMTTWMQEFKYDSLKNDAQMRIKYLQSELDKVNKMKDAVLGSIGKADSLLLNK